MRNLYEKAEAGTKVFQPKKNPNDDAKFEVEFHISSDFFTL